MAVAVVIKALLVATICIQQLAAADCPSTMAAKSFNFPQSYQGNEEPFDWLISFTEASTATPTGDAACPAGVYVGQYSPGAADAAACITTAPTATKTDQGCKWSTTQVDNGGTSRTFDMTVNCDATATALTPPTAFYVTAGTNSDYTYTGTFTSPDVCGSAPGPGPGPNPGPGPSPSGLDEYEKEPCSGGCAFLIVFFGGMFVYFVAAIVFNIVTGKRGREAAPNSDFWSEIPSLVKDGVMFLVRVITCRASAGAGYQQV